MVDVRGTFSSETSSGKARVHQPSMFKLDQNPHGTGLRCDEGGLFLGRVALLKRDRSGIFEARPVAEVKAIFERAYDGQADWESRIRSVHLIADTLNKGDVALAMMAAVLMRLPDPSENVPIAEGALEKAGYNSDEPRDERGRWARERSSDGSADAELRQTNPHENMWQMLGSELSDEAKAVLATMGQAQIDARNAEITAATTARNKVANWLGEFAAYRAKPWLGSDGNPVQVPVINTGDPLSDQAALMGHELFEPNAPLVRDGTNADWIDPLLALTSAGAIAAGVTLGAGALGAGGLGAGAVEGGGAEALGAEAESVWSLSPIPRGIAIEQQLAETEYADWYWIGREKNGFFPLVDFQEGDTLVSLRTVDTSGISWFGRIVNHIETLGSNGATIDGKLARMALDLRVQPGGIEDAQALESLGLKNGVTVWIREFP